MPDTSHGARLLENSRPYLKHVNTQAAAPTPSTARRGTLLGSLLTTSTPSESSSLDRALIDLTSCGALLDDACVSDIVHVVDAVDASRGVPKVQLMTASKPCQSGRVLATPSFIQMPPSTSFQEVWTVETDEPYVGAAQA